MAQRVRCLGTGDCSVLACAFWVRCQAQRVSSGCVFNRDPRSSLFLLKRSACFLCSLFHYHHHHHQHHSQPTSLSSLSLSNAHTSTREHFSNSHLPSSSSHLPLPQVHYHSTRTNKTKSTSINMSDNSTLSPCKVTFNGDFRRFLLARPAVWSDFEQKVMYFPDCVQQSSLGI